jgi:hypothetical protein
MYAEAEKDNNQMHLYFQAVELNVSWNAVSTIRNLNIVLQILKAKT